VGRIGKLNPLFSETNPVDRDITSLIYEGLTSINEFGEIVPDLATGWVVSADGLDYIFALRQDVLWQDGIPFTSADVAYTVRTLRSADFPGDPALSAFWQTVEMQVLDDYTIRFRLVQPLASFPERLRQGIVPVHALDGAPIATLDQHPFNLSPIGTGPYQIENLFSSNGQISGISLRVAPNYRLRPEGMDGYAIDRIVFRTYDSREAVLAAFQAGEVNSVGYASGERADELREVNGLALHTSVAPGVGVLIYNWQRDELAYLRDQRMRLAFATATDRESAVMRSMVGRAIPADSPILPNSWAFNPNAHYPEPNLDEARRLMETVSFEAPALEAPESEEGDEGESQPAPPPVEIRRNFRILVIDDPEIASIAFEIATQWNQLGFSVELEQADRETYLARLQAGDFDTAIVEYNFMPKADPDQFVLWHSGQAEVGQNYGGMDDGYLSNLLAQARTDPNGLHRKQHYDAFQEAFTSRAPALVLYYPIFVYATDLRLQGVQLDFISTPSDRFRTIKDWYFGG
jgi:peptide/nickel transport system substrate-binding protein